MKAVKWHGTTPIVVGTADENGNPLETLTLNPGDEIPPIWLERMKAAGHVDMIGSHDPLDMSEVKKFYDKRKAGAH